MRLLVFGLSGQVGDALRPRLGALGATVVALSRQPRLADGVVTWLAGSLEQMPALPDGIDTVVSLGPLDAFAHWFAQAAPAGVRVVALGSTGRVHKATSPDPAERALARTLAASEASLCAAAIARGAALTVLRPTLLYGNGRDRTLSPLVALAVRWRIVPLPWSARGLRQPVHVADVADAVIACLRKPDTAGQAFDLPGGETLAFDAMLRRTLAAQAPGARVMRLPGPVFTLVRVVARLIDAGSSAAGDGAVQRLSRDQLADPGPARAAFSWAPRRFVP
jgi:nucleoside-diphosphate-sugar epimerase